MMRLKFESDASVRSRKFNKVMYVLNTLIKVQRQ